MQAHNILHFWFEELTNKQHFAKEAVPGLRSNAEELAFLNEAGSSF